MGLNDNYVVVRENILMTDPMPQIGQALSMVLQKERQRELQASTSLFGGSSTLFCQHKSSPMPPKSFPQQQFSSSQYARPPSQHHSSQSSQQNIPSSVRRNSLFNNYCRRNGHTIDEPFKLQRQQEDTSLDNRRRVGAAVQHDDGSVPDQPAPSFTAV